MLLKALKSSFRTLREGGEVEPGGHQEPDLDLKLTTYHSSSPLERTPSHTELPALQTAVVIRTET
jgi:hypothetical protein